jgi:hypothetical protein
MKTIKHIYIILIITFLLTISSLTINANSKSYSDDNSASWQVNEKTVNNIGNLTHTLMYGTSTDTTQQTQGNQKVNVFEMKTDGINSKLVSWAMQTGKGSYARNGLSIIAEDYEEKHPGWIVVAGINGDQYYTKYGSGLGADGSFYYPNQPYYPMIIDGERRFPVTPTGNSASNYVGIANNNLNDSFVPASQLSNVKIEVLNESDEVIYIHDVNKINESPNEGETSVWFAHPSTESNYDYATYDVSSDKDLYVIEMADLAYMNNSRTFTNIGGIDSLFGRGTITLLTKNQTIDKWQIAIDTNDNTLRSNLSLNTKVRIQYYYENEEMNKVESSFGYHSAQRENNIDIKTKADYDARRYNRSIFGKKADGTYVLMTVAKGTYSGTTQDESNAILKQFGVTDAYQQDGGGSVTAIVRNEYGTFDIVNESSDSGVKQRSILSGCFFVIRDPGYISYQKDSTRTSITITKTNNYNDEYISNVVATINGKEYKLENDNLIIEGLEDDTEYKINLTYDVKINNQTVKGYHQIIGHTDSFTIPSHGVKEQNITANQVEFIRNSTVDDEYIYVKLKLNDQEYDLLEENKPVIIKNLTPSTRYNYTITYAVKDTLTGKTFEKTVESTFITEKYNLPTINKFDVTRTGKDKVTINVEIIDEFNLAYSYYIMYNGNQYALESLNETIEIEDLNIKDEEYIFQLIIQYKTDTTFSSLESQQITINSNTSYQNNSKGCNKCNLVLIELTTLLSLCYFIFKKK